MVAAPGPTIGRQQVDAAVAKLRDRIGETMASTGVPGLAVGVVFDDEVIVAEGTGARTLGQPEEVDADTVFQIASLSKSLGGSVMCALVREGALAWDDPVRTGSPELALADPWVSEHVTFADLFSHRSGLPEHAGDLLEDLGYGRDAVLERLRLYPLAPFRASYGYTNFGLTAAGVAGAARAGMTWEDASEALLYKPLGMASTSSTHAGFAARLNRVAGHVRRDGSWMVTPQPRQPDGQSPAGGVSSSVNDLLHWLAMMIRGGTAVGGYVGDPGALAQSWLPHAIANPPDGPTGRAGFYGLGLNVGYDDGGRVRLGHSGAFALGAGTAMTFFPAERIGAVVLTNGEPTGLAEATVESFFDDVFLGEQRNDWLAVIGPFFDRLIHPAPKKDFAPPGSVAAGPDERYIGTYDNDLYGPLEVTPRPGGGLELTVGPDGQAYPLHPNDGDELWWQFAGENAGPPAAATFAVDAGGRATSVTLDHFDEEGLGTFTRC
ncbi:MAG TPA: serine hydrolase [Solirubrobacterales bacterium]|nr:serine hydrolase [Solirubrobacterales bacterium]